MACSCADKWSTTILASRQGLTWKHARADDRDSIEKFISSGGCGSTSIDKFAKNELLSNSEQRYSNTFLLLNSSGELVGFVSNAMATIPMDANDMMDRNMIPVESVPVLFLHRLAVHHKHHGKGVGHLLVWRVFEALEHSCTHCSASAVALLVEDSNERAKKLYASLAFEKIGIKGKKKEGKELHIAPYDSAIKWVQNIDAMASQA